MRAGTRLAAGAAAAATVFAALIRMSAAYSLSDVSYGPDPANRLDVCRPQQSGASPAVVMIHGGGWIAGDRSGQRWMCDMAAARGIVAIPINYRLADGSSPHRWPAQNEDIRAAVAWAVRNAGSLGIDPARICVMGDSAGGHLALYFGLSNDGTSHIACIVSFFGPSNLATWRGAPYAYLFGERDPTVLNERIRLASPSSLVGPRAPPVLFVHGLNDKLVPISQSEEMLHALQNSGASARLITYQGGHSFSGLSVEQRYQLLDEAFAFVRSPEH